MILPQPNRLSAIVLLLSSAFHTTANAQNIFTHVHTPTRGEKFEQHLISADVSCTVVPVFMTGNPDHNLKNEIKYRCKTDDGVTFKLIGDANDIMGNSYEKSKDYDIVFSFPPSAILDHRTIDLNDEKFLAVLSTSVKEAAVGDSFRHSNKGSHKAIVVRIVDSTGSSPGLSESGLHQLVFKNNNGRPSAAEVFEGCSNGQFTFEPATGSDVNNGVITINIDYDHNGKEYDEFDDEIMDILDSMTGVDRYVYRMMISPKNAKWYGYYGAADEGYTSWYNGKKGIIEDRHTIIVHEVGHNLSLGHSGWDFDEDGNQENSERYDDVTCQMGGSPLLGTGKRCFNAAKTHYLGWFSDYAKVITPTMGAFEGTLVSVNDVVQDKNSPEQWVTVRLVAPDTEHDLFMMYYLMEGVNGFEWNDYYDTFNKKVVIVSQRRRYGASWIEAYLSAGETYRKSNWDSTGNTLKVTVCSINPGDPDTAVVHVNVNSVNSGICGSTPAPTPFDNSKPTPAPVLPNINIKKVSNYDEGIKVKFNYPASTVPQEDHWIGIFVNDDNVALDMYDGNDVHLSFYLYTSAAKTRGKVTFDAKDPKIEYFSSWPLPPGNYRACLLDDPSDYYYNVIGSCTKFRVKVKGKKKKMVKLATLQPGKTEFNYGEAITARFETPISISNSKVEIYEYSENFPNSIKISNPLMWVYTACGNVMGDQTETTNCAKKKKKGRVIFSKENTGGGNIGLLPPGRYNMIISFDVNLPYKRFKGSDIVFDVKDNV